MARDRWTLALIIICLPILATVITAFRVRDLPKAQELTKLQTKKTQPCEHCDVKVDNKVHSDKIQSDKHRNEDLKKTVSEKQTLTGQKLDSKSNHKYDVRSDKDDDDDELEFSKFQTGFRQEVPKVRKLEKSGPEIIKKASVTKLKYGDDDDDDDDDDIPKMITKPKLGEIKKPSIQVPNTKHDIKTTDIRITKNELKENDGDDEDDDDDEDDEDDNYDGLENIEELFKILHMEKKPDLKSKQENKAVKSKVNIEQKSKKPVFIKRNIDDDDEDDDDEDEDDKIAQKSTPKKISSIIVSKNEKESLQKPIVHESKDTKSNEKRQTDSIEKDDQKHLPKPVFKHDKENSKKIEESKTKQSPNELKKTESSQREDKVVDDRKPHPSQKFTKDPSIEKDKPSPVLKKEEKKLKDNISGEKTKQETVQKIKEPVKEPPKPKIHETESKTPDAVKKPHEHDKSKEVKLDKKEQKLEFKKVEKDKSEENKEERKIVHEPKKKDSDSKVSFEYKKDKFEPEKPQLLSKIREKHSAEKYSDSEEASTTSHLKHVTEALHRRNLLKSEFEDFYSFFPTFAPNFSRIHNAECRRHGQIVLRQLRGTKLWALNSKYRQFYFNAKLVFTRVLLHLH